MALQVFILLPRSKQNRRSSARTAPSAVPFRSVSGCESPHPSTPKTYLHSTAPRLLPSPITPRRTQIRLPLHHYPPTRRRIRPPPAAFRTPRDRPRLGTGSHGGRGGEQLHVPDIYPHHDRAAACALHHPPPVPRRLREGQDHPLSVLRLPPLRQVPQVDLQEGKH
jgi:hypothetical protein